MPAATYHFVTGWRVRGDVHDVFDVLARPDRLHEWWPSVYLRVHPRPDDRVTVETKGWLPYLLRWTIRPAEQARPHRLVFEATGDFEGRGEWTLRQDGPWVDARFDWRIGARKPLLRRWSFLLRPVFSANHGWAMERGEESLQIELDRRNGKSDREPPPPAPIWPWRALVVGTVIVSAWVLARRAAARDRS